ncbi:MAG: KUP/HAK/KT family potassium transporter [Pirellulales bacterium]|nr:KUP/HAK/KT family potassium transporter [Pirellulales bacterium]
MSIEGEHRSRPLAAAAFLLVALHATGVVYGDIGTSVLYAVNEIFFGHGGAKLYRENILGAISLALWALTFVVTIKYVWCVLYADHRGEGGVFALFAKVALAKSQLLSTRALSILLLLAAGMLYGDGIITPAISVLGAVEGLKVITPAYEEYVVVFTILILFVLFSLQRFGTASIGSIFGPTIVVWFTAIGILGAMHALRVPDVFWALNPWYAARFLWSNDAHTVLSVLGSVILVVTGGEALYADMGHFGRRPIQFSWMVLAYPCLTLNYLGQGAYLLSGQEVMSNNVFFSMVPTPALLPMVVLATAAAVIASQALISGAFSLTAQATALGLLPRFRTTHTSSSHEGQIYLPAVNTALLIGCLVLVIFFQSSTNLAAAYGMAVAGVMLVTSLSMFHIALVEWQWKSWKVLATFGTFAAIDFAFLTANSLKFTHGGYIPILIGLVLFALMAIWRRGRQELALAYREFTTKDIGWLVARKAKAGEAEHLHDSGLVAEAQALHGERILRILPRGSVFLSSRPIDSVDDTLPAPIRAFLKRYGAIADEVVIFHVRQVSGVPTIPRSQRYEVFDFGESIVSVIASYGFRDEISIDHDIRELQRQDKLLRTDRLWTVEVGQEEILIDSGYSDLQRFWHNFVFRGVMKLFIRTLGLIGVQGIARYVHIPALRGMPFWRRLRYAVFRGLVRRAVPVHQYFGVAREVNISTILIPIVVASDGVKIYMPDLETPQRDESLLHPFADTRAQASQETAEDANGNGSSHHHANGTVTAQGSDAPHQQND